MSSDLDRLLREGRDALPAPDEPSTEEARRRVLAALRPRRRRTRFVVLAGAMVATALLLGVSAGSLNAPGVTAAREPAVLGFVPEPGWFALQSPPPAIEGQQTVAVAANVPFSGDDVDDGLVEPSGLPYSTLLTLPPRGIVIVSTMTPQTVPHVAPVQVNPLYPDTEFPLQLRDALRVVEWGAQVRPDQPMAQYHLRALLAGHNVDVIVYFGTAHPSPALLREAQSQLSGFVVRPDAAAARAEPATTVASDAPEVVFDRTYVCNTVLLGGVYAIELRAHAGVRAGRQWSKLPYAVVSSGGWAGLLSGYPYARDNSLAWMAAGDPARDTTADVRDETFPVATGGTLGVNRTLCRPSPATVPLHRATLRGGMTGSDGEEVDCEVSRRVLVRIRATTLTVTSFTRRGQMLVATNAVVRRGELTVRTPAGRLVAYAHVSDPGRSGLFVSKGCTREQ